MFLSAGIVTLIFFPELIIAGLDPGHGCSENPQKFMNTALFISFELQKQLEDDNTLLLCVLF